MPYTLALESLDTDKSSKYEKTIHKIRFGLFDGV